MHTSSKAELIACLRQQLEQAEARLDRWEKLGAVMRTTNADSWKLISILRREEVEQFRVLLEWAEKEPASQALADQERYDRTGSTGPANS